MTQSEMHGHAALPKRKRRRRGAEDKYAYLYIRDLLLPLILRAALDLGPTLRMTGEDCALAEAHRSDGSWSTGLDEAKLPQFQQDHGHSAFCAWRYGDGE